MRCAIVTFLAVGCVGETQDLGDRARPASDGGTTFDAGAGDSGELPDAGQMADAGADAGPLPRGACNDVTDCADLFEPASLPTCPGAAFSCLVGRCVFECAGAARTCDLDTAGCVVCDDGTRSCAGQPCTVPDLSMGRIEQSTCARFHAVDIVECHTEFGWLETAGVPDEPCSIVWLPTGAPRAVLSCGICQEQLSLL